LDGQCRDEVLAALRVARDAVAGPEVDLSGLQKVLVASLQLQYHIQRAIASAVRDGGLQLREPELYDEIALWLIDRQLGEGLNWDSDAAL
jgi:hypothetical protein